MTLQGLCFHLNVVIFTGVVIAAEIRSNTIIKKTSDHCLQTVLIRSTDTHLYSTYIITMCSGSFRPPKQWILTENETITSFANWQSNMQYHLSLSNDFVPFLDSTLTWMKASVPNRGLSNDDKEVAEAHQKTAVQKCIQLNRMLGLIAQFAPSLLRNDIIKKSTSLSWIWQRIRKHYSFRQSEV